MSPNSPAPSNALLILPTSTYRASDFIDAARALGVRILVGSDQRQTLADSIVLRLDRPDEAAKDIIEHHRADPLDAIVAVDDQGVLAATLAAAELGLPHNDPAAAARTRDKVAMRQALDGVVPQPTFRVARPDADVGGLAREVGLPVVCKPVSLSASRGVIRADTPQEAVEAVARIRRILDCAGHDPDEPLLIERFVSGDEVALEGLLRNGELEVLAIFDKPDPLDGPYFEETLYVTPSRQPDDRQRAIVATASDAAAALGLSEGPVHAELRVGADGTVTFLELAARSIGGLCARTLRFGLGVSLEELILRHALGRDLGSLRREPDASGVMMLPIPRAGTLREVRGQDEARRVPGIVGLEFTVHPGREVEPLPEGDRYLGFLFARGPSPETVESSLREAHARLDVVIA